MIGQYTNNNATTASNKHTPQQIDCVFFISWQFFNLLRVISYIAIGTLHISQLTTITFYGVTSYPY